MNFTIDETSDQATPTMVVLQSCDEITGLLPVGHCGCVDTPETDGLVRAARRNAELLCHVEDRTGDDSVVGQLLDRTLVIQVPDYHLHVGSCCQQVVFVRLLWTPVYVEDV